MRLFGYRINVKAPARTVERRAPSDTGADWVSSDAEIEQYASTDGREELTQRKALTLPPVFVSLNNVAKLIAAHTPGVYNWTGPDDKPEPVKNHPFEHLLAYPNPHISSTFLFWFTALSLPLRGNAFWYLRGDGMGGIREIWPIPPFRVTPVPSEDTDTFIKHFEYRAETKGEPILLPTENVCWFRQPNIFDLFDGMSSITPLVTSVNTSKSRRTFAENFFGPRSARPTTHYEIRKPMTVPQFEVIKESILTQLQMLTRSALITRESDIKITPMDMSVDDLGLIDFERFDSMEMMNVLGWSEALGSKNTTYASSWAALDLVDSFTAWPMAELLAGDITTQIIRPIYGEGLICKYEDFRQGRRSEDRADFSAYSPYRTVNENRKKRGDPPVEGEYAGVSEEVPAILLPYHFQQKETPPEAPEQPEEVKADLEKWERKALRRLSENGSAAATFETMHVLPELHSAIAGALMLAVHPEEVREIFKSAGRPVNGHP